MNIVRHLHAPAVILVIPSVVEESHNQTFGTQFIQRDPSAGERSLTPLGMTAFYLRHVLSLREWRKVVRSLVLANWRIVFKLTRRPN